MASSTDEEALNTIITEVKEEHTTYAVYVAPAPDSSDFTVPEALEVIQSHAVWPIESVLPTKSVNTTEVTATYVPVTTSEGGDVIGHVLPLALHTFERPNTSLLVITFGKDLSAAINISHFSKLPSSVVIRVLSATKPATIRAADTATLTDIAARIQVCVCTWYMYVYLFFN